MLANGATLGYKTKGGNGDFTNLPGLKEIPELGMEPENVDNTVLTDPHRKYEQGIGDLGEVSYLFKYDNTSANSPYRLMRAAQNAGTELTFQETLKDGTVTEFDAFVAVKRTGGGVNGVIEFRLNMTITSDITVTDPA